MSHIQALMARQLAALQSTNEVLMVAPTAFTYNEQTAQDNHFMHTGPTDASTSIMQVKFKLSEMPSTQHRCVVCRVAQSLTIAKSFRPCLMCSRG